MPGPTPVPRTALPLTSLLFLLSAVPASPAQERGVRGVVRDGDGTPVAEATVLVDGGVRGGTDARGRFAVGLAPGPVRLTIERLGFTPWTGRVEVPSAGWVDVEVVLRTHAVELNPLVVTGTLGETRVADSPVKVDVVSGRLLERHAASSLMDGIGRINGLYPQVDCGVCYTNNIRINGMEGPYTAVLVDGVPLLGGLASVYGLEGIHPSMVERLEILKGPQSTLHGTEAMGGVVNVVTKDARYAPRLAVTASRTSLAEYDAALSWAPGSGRRGTLFSASLVHNDAFVDDNRDGFSDLTLDTRWSVFARTGLLRGDRRVGSVSARYYGEDRFGGVAEGRGGPRGSGTAYGEWIRTDRLELLGRIEGPWADTRVEVSAAHHRQDSWYGTTPFAADQTVVFGRVLWDPPRRTSRHDLLAGAVLEGDRYDDSTPATAAPHQRWIPALFVEDQFHPGAAWTLLGGLRVDHHREHGAVLSPRASALWRPDADASFRVNVGTGFRVVHLFTEDHAALTGARDVVIEGQLRPERSVSVAFNYNQVLDLGARPMMIDVDAFWTRFSNRIIPDYDVHPDRIVYRNLEGRRSLTRGIAVSLNQNFGESLPLFYTLGITIQDVFVEGSGTPREEEFFAADYRGVWSLSYAFRPGLTLDYGGALTGPMRLPEFDGEWARPTRSRPYATHDLQVTWSRTPGQEVVLGVQNLTGFRQESPLVDPERPFGDAFDTSYVYGPVVGRRLSVGVRYTRGR